MFTVGNAAPDATMVFVSFTNVILSSHTVEPETYDLNDLDAFNRNALSAAIFSNTGGVSINLKTVTITRMDAGAGAVGLYGQVDTLRGNLTVSASTITANTARNFAHAAGITVRDSATVRISASTFTSNIGFAVDDALDAASALLVVTSDGVAIESSTFKGNQIDIAENLEIFVGTAYISQVPQVAVIATTFAENLGDTLVVFGDPANADSPTATLLVKATTFTKNRGAITGGLVYADGAACISATTFNANVAIGSEYFNDNDEVLNNAAGALVLFNSITSGSGNTFKANRVVPTGLTPNTADWAQAIMAAEGASAVFTSTTVHASGAASPADITASDETALSFCKCNFVRVPKGGPPVTLATVSDPANTLPAGTIDVCPTTPYIVLEGTVTAMCNVCSAAGTTDCGKAMAWAWMPWLKNTVYPNYWQSGLGFKAQATPGVGAKMPSN
jgi:hypothetical protein